jgi:hypothetical protein
VKVLAPDPTHSFDSKSLSDLVRLVREAAPRAPREFQLSVNDLFQDVVLKLIAVSARPRDITQEPCEHDQ